MADMSGYPQAGSASKATTVNARQHHYGVEIDGVTALFNECSAIDSTTQVAKHFMTSKDGHSHIVKAYGNTDWNNVTLKQGVTTSDDLRKWRQDVTMGKDARKTITITHYTPDMQPITRTTLINAWPTKLSTSQLNASGNGIIVESLELAHEGAVFK